MKWKKLQQEEAYFEGIDLCGDIYKEHLVLLSTKKGYDFQEDRYCENNQLRCWNLSTLCLPSLFLIVIDTNSWRIFNIKEIGLEGFFGSPIVYKNSLLILGKSKEKLCLVSFNLEGLDLEAPLSPEQQLLKSFCMSEKEADIKFKVQEKIISAHKQVLIEKSRFFAGLFKS